jgi:Xaa-Pro aminopeptidase
VLYAALRRPIPLYPIPKVDLEGYCSKVPGIPTSEFEARQAALAQTLQTIGGGSYLAEPGASAGYFGNLSSSHWHLSERPLLLHISLEKSKDTEAQAAPHVTVLTPSFEASRAKLLPLAGSSISWVEWPEHEDPFKTLMSALPPHVRSSPVYVDGSIRNFVATGLSRAGADVQPAPASVTALRERKSRAEIDIMKCANEATLHAIRQVRAQMRIGMRESQVRGMVTDALKSAGLSNNWVLALFGDNAALPHGGGADRVLGETEFILIDAGGSLQGYGSDVTRVRVLCVLVGEWWS